MLGNEQADSGTYSKDVIDRKRAIAQALLQQTLQPQKITHWAEGLAELGRAGLGSYLSNQADTQDKARQSGVLAALLGNNPAPPSVSPDISSPQNSNQSSISPDDKSIPASIRTNNPGAQWPGQVASQFGATGSQTIGGNNQIATFNDPVSGAAAQFGLLAKNYAGMPLGQAIQKWSGGNSAPQYTQAVSRETGLDPNTPLTPDLLKNPQIAIPLAKAMAKQEAGRDYPLSDQQWQQAHQMALGGQPQQVASLDPSLGLQAPPATTNMVPTGAQGVAQALGAQPGGSTPVASPQMAQNNQGGLLANVPPAQRGVIQKLLQSDPSLIDKLVPSLIENSVISPTLAETIRHNQAEENKPISVTSGAQLIRPSGEKVADNNNASLDPDTVNAMAKQYMAGDKSVLQNIGRGNQGASNLVALRKEITNEMTKQGISPETQALKMAEFTGLTRGEGVLGARTAQIGMAVNEAKQLIPLALDASQSVDRTNYPSLNAIELAVKKGTGDENAVRFNVANNSLVNVYARAINPSGASTVSDKEHAREILETAFSKGQYAAGVNQLQLEMEAAQKSPGQTMQDFRDLHGGQQIQGNSSQQSATPASNQKVTKTINGKNYYQENGQWYEE